MTNPLSTLQTDLNTLATADTSTPATGTATPTAALTAAQEVLSLLADTTLVGNDIGAAVSGMYKAIHDAISNDAVAALQKIANELTTTLASLNLSDAASALNALQNALQTAQSLMPGGSSAVASGLASTSQFATLFGNLLSDPAVKNVTDAANILYEIAQQLGAVANAFQTAESGNP